MHEFRASTMARTQHRKPDNPEFLFVGEDSASNRRAARAHLAHKSRKRRIQADLQSRNARETPEVTSSGESHEHTVTLSPSPSIFPILTQISNPATTIDRLLSVYLTDYVYYSWGVSNMLCPSPQQVDYTISLGSPAHFFFSCANAASFCVRHGLWRTQDEKNEFNVAALTHRAEALKLVNNLLAYEDGEVSVVSQMTPSQVNPELTLEKQFAVVLKLLQSEYRYGSPTFLAHHFKACRHLLHSHCRLTSRRGRPQSLAHSSSQSLTVPQLRNAHIRHLAITFEIIKGSRDSIFWEPEDVSSLEAQLRELVRRLELAIDQTTEVVKPEDGHPHDPRPIPRIPPSSLLWRCLDKEPAKVRGNSYYDIAEEASGQLATLMTLCSICMDYECEVTSSRGCPDDAKSAFQQCISEVEDALASIDEQVAVSSGLNAAWLIAGGLGIPIVGRNERIWVLTGMMFVLKQTQVSSESDDTLPPVSQQHIRQLCKTYLQGGHPG